MNFEISNLLFATQFTFFLSFLAAGAAAAASLFFVARELASSINGSGLVTALTRGGTLGAILSKSNDETRLGTLVERFDIEPFPDFSAK